MDRTGEDTEFPQVTAAPGEDMLAARIISHPGMPKDRIRFIDADGRCVGEIVMDADDRTTDDPEVYETKVDV